MRLNKRRPMQHIMEEQSSLIIRKKFPEEWVFHQYALDYGIDLVVETFFNTSLNKINICTQKPAKLEDEILSNSASGFVQQVVAQKILTYVTLEISKLQNPLASLNSIIGSPEKHFGVAIFIENCMIRTRKSTD